MVKKHFLLVFIAVLLVALVVPLTLFGCKATPGTTTTAAATEETTAAATEETTAAATGETTAGQDLTGTIEAKSGLEVKRDVALSFALLKGKDNSTFEIVQSNKMVGMRWFDLMEMGIDEFAKDFKVKASNVAPDAGDPALQAQITEDLIVKLKPKTSVIILVPNDPKSLDPVAKKANDKGIYTIGYEGTTLQNITYDMEAYDNARFGAMMGEYLAKWMGGKGKYAVAVGLLTMEVHVLWADSAVKYIKENYPDMELVTSPYIETSNDQGKAYSQAQELLKAYPDLGGILAAEGAMVAAGAQVVEEKNLIGKVAVSGLGLPSTVYDFIKSGAAKSVHYSNPLYQSYALGVVALAVLNGIELHIRIIFFYIFHCRISP
ncbi:MAG: substrate-binding domain-containing protein [Actinobacteria bacterium]|nr:substrate-binding domain-containing protein [Actinomycetota bacterium]